MGSTKSVYAVWARKLMKNGGKKELYKATFSTSNLDLDLFFYLKIYFED